MDERHVGVTRRAQRERPTLILAATAALLVGATMLLPAATAPTASAQVASTSAEPSASLAPSASASAQAPGSPLPDAGVQLAVLSGDDDPVRDWAVSVRGGTASLDAFTIPFDQGDVVGFTVNVFGQSASVEIIATLPAGSELLEGTCIDNENIERDVLVAPGRLVVDVAQGNYYTCYYSSLPLGQPEPTERPQPTAPPTDSLAAQTSSSSERWPMVLAFIVAVIAAGVLITVWAQRRS